MCDAQGELGAVDYELSLLFLYQHVGVHAWGPQGGGGGGEEGEP